jgi:hypothetical protein
MAATKTRKQPAAKRKTINDYRRLKLWILYELRLRQLEAAIESGKRYRDTITDADWKEELRIHGGPRGYFFEVAQQVATLFNDEETHRRYEGALGDLAKDFGLTFDQAIDLGGEYINLCALDNMDEWDHGDLRKLHRKLTK